MKAPIRKTIDGVAFDFFFLSPKVAIKVLARIAKLIGEPLGNVADVVLKGGAGGKVSVAGLLNADLGGLPPDLLSRAVKSLVERLDEGEVIETVDAILEKVHMQGDGDKGTRPLRIETDFGGKIMLMFKVVGAALEVNYGDFFGAGSGLSGALAAAAPRTTSV